MALVPRNAMATLPSTQSVIVVAYTCFSFDAVDAKLKNGIDLQEKTNTETREKLKPKLYSYRHTSSLFYTFSLLTPSLSHSKCLWGDTVVTLFVKYSVTTVNKWWDVKINLLLCYPSQTLSLVSVFDRHWSDTVFSLFFLSFLSFFSLFLSFSLRLLWHWLFFILGPFSLCISLSWHPCMSVSIQTGGMSLYLYLYLYCICICVCVLSVCCCSSAHFQFLWWNSFW